MAPSAARFCFFLLLSAKRARVGGKRKNEGRANEWTVTVEERRSESRGAPEQRARGGHWEGMSGQISGQDARVDQSSAVTSRQASNG
ncbi:hypothetical protein DFH27DRAFT_655126 [Peziza echinospora]|nr:hypothetical protein DFH27DRAFT_655126 [Peziza echinospora]